MLRCACASPPQPTGRCSHDLHLTRCACLDRRLVHDFTTHADEDNNDYSPLENRPRYSITLNGRVHVETGERAERYRQIHLAHNTSYSQFIVGEGIAIITVHLQRARVCDVNDRVSHYQREDGKKRWAELPQTP